MGEGGAILVNHPEGVERAEIIREKGTNRSKFFRGEVDKYTWVDAGSSYLPSELNAAYLWAQLEQAQRINENRLHSWNQYRLQLEDLEQKGYLQLPYVPPECQHNGHIFYIKTANLEERNRLMDYMKQREIGAIFHYLPLHSAAAGKRYGDFYGEDRYTTRESNRLLRLPMYYDLRPEDLCCVTEAIHSFYLGN
jgi:dTDP-4-amino-4,6-dideoxygalactose transaminase